MNNHNYILSTTFSIVYVNSMYLYSIRLETIKKTLKLITLQSYEIVNGWENDTIHQLTSLV